jgi:hypothetical protein
MTNIVLMDIHLPTIMRIMYGDLSMDNASRLAEENDKKFFLTTN